MVCKVCRAMLCNQTGSVWKGSYDLEYEHHKTGKDLMNSVDQKCCICRALNEDFNKELQREKKVDSRAVQVIRYLLSLLCFGTFTPEPEPMLPTERLQIAVTARLSAHEIGRLYSLDMTLQHKRKQRHIQVQHTFFLETMRPGDTVHSARISDATSSKEVFGTAMQWMSLCQCAETSTPEFYPLRLISLKSLKCFTGDGDESEPYIKERPTVDVKVVETESWSKTTGRWTGPDYDVENPYYVTLSHCWGNNVKPEHQLNDRNYEKFRESVRIGDLPKTFRQAISFAAKLPKVGYIWIDSLCIIQQNSKDWLNQSSNMNRVYSQSHLNLSATASSGSDGGLFRPRDPTTLSMEVIDLNVTGLPGHYPRKGLLTSPSDMLKSIEMGKTQGQQYVQQCAILDASLWSDRVGDAPVNRRSWVLQERLMSPRVLHFCKDQIAWECLGRNDCKGFDGTERQPHGLSEFRLTSRGIVKSPRLKHLNINEMNQSKALNHWARIVEAYSRTEISWSTDKLIALAGMARMMETKIGSKYVAGLWRDNLESQLLWYVDPIFEPTNRTFSNPATFDKKYRAPSFSWAALNVTNHGIVYGGTANRGNLIKVKDVEVNLVDENNPYGLIRGKTYKADMRAKITLWGQLRAITLFRTEPAKEGRFAWQLIGRGGQLDKELHTNVYLDCPIRDRSCINNKSAKLFVVPAARIPDGNSENLICLILRRESNGKAFSRIGLTKLTPYIDRQAMSILPKASGFRILEIQEDDDKLPHSGGWDPATGRHQICII